MTTEQQQNGEFLMSKDQTKPTAWRYENKNVKGNWYITWTEPPDGFNKRPLYDDSALQAAIAAEREACAVVCDTLAYEWRGANSRIVECAAAIRARGDSK